MFRSDASVPAILGGRRVARSVFGLVLIAGALLLFYRVIAEDVPYAAEVLLGTWGAAITAGFLAGRLARSSDWPPPGDRLLIASLVLPSIGMALVTPLTLHLSVAAFLGEAGTGFDEWAATSVVAVGIAHGGLAGMAAIRARRVATGGTLSLGWVYAVPIALSLFPFGMYLLPPLIVAVTGLPILPLMLVVDWIVERERALAARPHAPPRATVVSLDAGHERLDASAR